MNIQSISELSILFQQNLAQIIMELTIQDQTQRDLFESEIMSEVNNNQEEIKQAAIKAARCSCRARGGQQSSVGDVWPLKHEVKQIKTFQQANIDQYGLQGILLKQSPGFFGSWQQRYVVLKNKRFIYKETKSPISPTAGILNFNLLSCEVFIQQQDNQCSNFRILVQNTDKQFVFKGKTQKETEDWLSAVNQAVQNSDGWRKNYSYLAHYPRFWRKDYQSEAQFRKVAEAGDILLFRGLKNSSIMQRVVTRDQFDHIGVILINQMGQPLVFQANGGFGVGLCSWTKFMSRKWWSQYDLIVHRKLQVMRNQKFLEEIQKFVAANMGKEYNFSFGDYLFYRNSSVQKQHQFYFCSSLVAKLYKRLGLLPPDKSCKQYLPSSFTQKENLQLKTDGPHGYAYLDIEKIIVFEQKKQ